MNKIEAITELNKLTSKEVSNPIARNSRAFKTASEAIMNAGEPQIAGKNYGKGRHATSITWAHQTAIIFNRLGVEYKIDNVAPKKGKHGDRITAIFN